MSKKDKPQLVNPAELIIDRKIDEKNIVLVDGNGDTVYEIPKATALYDFQIAEIIKFVNYAYQKGFNYGRNSIVNEVLTIFKLPVSEDKDD